MSQNNESDKPMVLVSGSSGLLGTAVCNALSERYRVIGLDRPGLPHPPPVAENVPVDLADGASVARALGHIRQTWGTRVASVVHLAAYYDFSGQPSDKYETVTVQGTRRLLEDLQAFVVEQFIFSSTMLVHAPVEPGETIDENSPIQPKWDYPASKVRTEAIIGEHRGPIPTVILRIAGVYDQGGDSIPLVQQMIRIREKRLTSRVFPGDLTHGQAFVHRDDVVDAIVRAVDRRGQLPAQTVLLIGEDKTLSYGTLQKEMGRLIQDEDWQTTTIPKFVAKTGAWVQDAIPGIEEPFIKPWMIDLADDHYALNISRAQQLLGWRPHHDLGQSLPKMVATMKADPKAWYAHNQQPWPGE